MFVVGGVLAFAPKFVDIRTALTGNWRSNEVGEISLVVAARDTEYCGYHTACGPGMRTDTIFYLRLRGSEATLVALPRDLHFVGDTPAGFYEGKINSVYERGGGAEGLRLAVEKVLGTPVEHYLILTFDSVMKLVNAVGGVDVVLPYPMKYTDRAAGLFIDFPAGPRHLDGKDTVKYMRFRRWEGSDLGRLDRIKGVLNQVARKAQSPRYWPRLPGVASSVWNSLETTVPLSTAIGLLPNLRGVSIKSATVPTLEEGNDLIVDPVAMVGFNAAMLGYTSDTEATMRFVQAEALEIKTLIVDQSGRNAGQAYKAGLAQMGLPAPEVLKGEPVSSSVVLVRSGSSVVGRDSPAFALARDYANLLHLPMQTRIRIEPEGYDVIIVLGKDVGM
jgi:polyisoprenyl-teichoic acid--peptidoglycan teichoic acid transferase